MKTLELETLRAALDAHEVRPAAEVIPGMVRKDAGVLVPIRTGARPTIVLTARSRAMRDHAGEVSFPGGKPQPEDRDLAATALREAHEEIGLEPRRVSIVGRLSSVPTATSAFRLEPFVGAIVDGDDRWALSREVDRVLELPIEDFVSGRVRFCLTMFAWRDELHPTPFFEVDDETVIYGATAYVLWEAFAVLAGLGAPLPEPVVVPPPPWTAPLIERFRALEDRHRQRIVE
ncbi:MAG: CoA pyrophosphatase [Myxococcales bacterium]|nr:CoA pyrophosphatase [Myxococcales bacterium]